MNAGSYWMGVENWSMAYEAYTGASEFYDLALGSYDACATAAFSQAWATGAAWDIMQTYQPWW